MAKDTSWNDDDADDVAEKPAAPKGGIKKQKFGSLNSGLKRKATRSGIAKPAVIKAASKKGL